MTAKHLEMDKEIKKDWAEFLEWIYTNHQLSRELWLPDYYSILLWTGFRKSKEK